jgi:hypothetical protein
MKEGFSQQLKIHWVECILAESRAWPFPNVLHLL